MTLVLHWLVIFTEEFIQSSNLFTKLVIFPYRFIKLSLVIIVSKEFPLILINMYTFIKNNMKDVSIIFKINTPTGIQYLNWIWTPQNINANKTTYAISSNISNNSWSFIYSHLLRMTNTHQFHMRLFPFANRNIHCLPIYGHSYFLLSNRLVCIPQPTQRGQ